MELPILIEEYVTISKLSGHRVLVSYSLQKEGEKAFYRVFLTANGWNDVDGDGLEGNDNLDDLTNYSLSGIGDNRTLIGLGKDNIIDLVLFQSKERLYDFDIDGLFWYGGDNPRWLKNEPRFVLVRGNRTQLKLFQCRENETREEYNIMGYRINSVSVSCGSSTSFFEIDGPDRRIHMYSPNPDDVWKYGYEGIAKRLENLTITMNIDCIWNGNGIDVWIRDGGDPLEEYTFNKRWYTGDHKKTYWQINSICCERSINGSLELERVFGTETCERFEDLGTNDGRTCMIEFTAPLNSTERLDYSATPTPVYTRIPIQRITPRPTPKPTKQPTATPKPTLRATPTQTPPMPSPSTPVPVCGDGVCGRGETMISCCRDCGCWVEARCDNNVCEENTPKSIQSQITTQRADPSWIVFFILSFVVALLIISKSISNERK